MNKVKCIQLSHIKVTQYQLEKKTVKCQNQNPASTIRNFQSTTYFVLISKVQVQVNQKKITYQCDKQHGKKIHNTHILKEQNTTMLF